METERKKRIPSFETSIRKAMGKKWDKLSPDKRQTVREISRCLKGGTRKMPSFLQRMKKAMGEKKWKALSVEDRKTVRELSRCEKGGRRLPLSASNED